MLFKQLLLLCYIILPCLMTLEAVKIGISKPLSTTTTVAPNITSLETTVSGEDDTEFPTTTPASLTNKTTITAPSTSSTTEWPEFPPRKHPDPKSTTTSTMKPLTTTKKPKTTTPKPTTESTDVANKTDEIRPETLALSTTTWSPHKYCFCDVTINVCDINCCCDLYCPADVLKVFKCLKADTNDFEIHEGRFEDFKFQHGLPSCELNDGWLCVFRTNIPPPAERAQPSFSDTSDYYTWPNLLREDMAREQREFYMYGDILKLINVETKDIREFYFPSSLKSPLCQTKEPIMHLKSQKISCLIPKVNVELEAVQPNFWELQNKYKILRKPKITEDVHNSKQLEDYMGNITLRWCNETLNTCQKANEQYVENLVYHELHKVQIYIFHNFTNIYGIGIDLWQGNREEDIAEESWLMYEVLFLNKTKIEMPDNEHFRQSKAIGQITSGPLGYDLGKPLIVAKYVPVNKSLPLSENNQELNYFSTGNNQRNIWSLLKKHKGLCKRLEPSEMEVEEEYISYGINIAKQCKIRMDNDTLLEEEPSKTNFTIICASLQNIILRQLLGQDHSLADLPSYFISQLGKPQNTTEKWLALNVFNADFIPVFGQYLENSGTFICRNILLSLSYEFHIGWFHVDGAAEQHLIKHANLFIGEKHDLEFSLDEHIEVPLTMTVRFYDVNEKAASASSCLWISLIMYFINAIIVFNV